MSTDENIAKILGAIEAQGVLLTKYLEQQAGADNENRKQVFEMSKQIKDVLALQTLTSGLTDKRVEIVSETLNKVFELIKSFGQSAEIVQKDHTEKTVSLEKKGKN